MKKNKKRTKILLLLLILCISIGYAILSANLTITGTTGIDDAKWDIHWENVYVTSGSVSGTNVTTPATIDSAKTTVSYNIRLDKPGDYYEFIVDAVNDGTIDAMIDTISSKLNGTEITTLPDYLEYSVTYFDDELVKTNQELLQGALETYKVRIGYKKDIDVSQLPNSSQSLNLQFTVIYKQKNNESIPTRDYVYTANRGMVYVGQAIPYNIAQLSTGEIALTVLRQITNDDNILYYLKHIKDNDIVKKSYLEFIITPEMVQENKGAHSGIYTLWGNDSEVAYEGNKHALLRAFGNSNCTDSSANFSCGEYNYGAAANETGIVDAGDGEWLCRVYSSNYSYCDTID